MPIGLFDSHIFGLSWSHPDLQKLFNEEEKIREWLRILVTLAESQAELNIIPRPAAAAIKKTAVFENLDLKQWESDYQKSGHSMSGLIKQVESQLPPNGQNYFYYGATVQDITDTWTSLALTKTLKILLSESLEIRKTLVDLTKRHQKTVMAGRTHGQTGAPITFGFKTASWAAEFHRHYQRLSQLESRIGFAQLSGSVGSMGAFLGHGPKLIDLFAQKLGLKKPSISWTSSRDSIVEFAQTLSLLGNSCEKIGNEIYNLQRSEVGEVREHYNSQQIGSITMPHKQNPEVSEHLGTLSRLIRHAAASLSESMIHEHERDGKSWKVEWLNLPVTCVLTGACLKKTNLILSSLEVDSVRMKKNLDFQFRISYSEQLMWTLAQNVGLPKAREVVTKLCKDAQDQCTDLQKIAETSGLLSEQNLSVIFNSDLSVQNCLKMIDETLEWIEHEA